MIAGFETIVDATSGPLGDLIRPAFALRGASGVLDAFATQETAFDAADTAFMLEAVDEGGDRHSVVLLILEADSGLLLANRMLLMDSTIFRLTEPGAVERSDLDSAQAREAFTQIGALDAPEGVGGDTTGFGGDVQFLTLRRSGAETRVILAGHQHAVLTPGARAADDPVDRRRQIAIDTLYLLWAKFAAVRP